ncbi:MAG: hypothetical protein ACOC9Q_01220, partial [bacterium]
DYFRYCAMLKLGGVCSDADMRCARALQPLIERAPSGLLVGRPNGVVINGFFAFRTAEHPLVRLALEIATVNIERRSSNDVWLTTGPGIFTMLSCLRNSGSVGEFRSIYIDRGGAMTTLAQTVCDVVEDDTCMENLFEGIVVLPSAELRRYVRGCVGLPYRTTPEHWVNWQARASIYAR